MKNILIMGIGRAGKTTLSEMIKNKYHRYKTKASKERTPVLFLGGKYILYKFLYIAKVYDLCYNIVIILTKDNPNIPFEEVI